MATLDQAQQDFRLVGLERLNAGGDGISQGIEFLPELLDVLFITEAALLLGDVLLQELEIRADLELDEVGRLDDFAEFAEVDAFGVSAVGHGISRVDVN